MTFPVDGTGCACCGRTCPRTALVASGRALCPRCRAVLPSTPASGRLQRLLRIRPRLAADGKTLEFERYEH